MSSQWHGGKGSGRRSSSISQEEWSNRWDNIFGRDLPKEDNTDARSTEDCLRSNEETQEAMKNTTPR
jgi:hypothetical protein